MASEQCGDKMFEKQQKTIPAVGGGIPLQVSQLLVDALQRHCDGINWTATCVRDVTVCQIGHYYKSSRTAANSDYALGMIKLARGISNKM